jgi:murein DD-endopeptidase MepM/ murein hydrolase activator NlpD
VSSNGVGQITASWLAASDDTTPPANLRYQLHASTEPGFAPSPATLRLEVTGALSGTITNGLTPGEQHHVRLVVFDEQNAPTAGDTLPVRVADTAATLVAGVVVRTLQATEVSQVDTDSITLTTGSTAPSVGTIIAGTEGTGFLRRVTGASTSNGQTVLATEPASLADAVADMQLSSTVRMQALPAATPSGSAAPGSGVQNLPAAPGSSHFAWTGSSFRYEAGHAEDQSQRQRALAAGGRAQIRSPRFEVSPSRRIAGTYGDVFVPERVGVDESGYGDIPISVATSTDALPWLNPNGPVTICSIEVAEVVHEDPAARSPVPLFVDFPEVMRPTRRHTDSGRVLAAERPLRVTPLGNSASGHPYKVRVQITLQDLNDNCRPSTARFFPEWRERLTVEVTVFVGNDAFPSNEQASAEASGRADGNGSIRIRNDASITFDPHLSYEIRVGRFPRGLEYARIGVEASPMLQQTLTIVAEARGSLNFEADLIRPRRFFKVFVTAAGLPVVISGEFTLKLKVEGEATGALEATERLDFGFDRLSFGVECTGLADCSVVDERTPVVRLAVGGNGRAQAHLQAALVPQLKIAFYEALGGQLTLDPKMRAEAGIEGFVQLDAAIDPDTFDPSATADADYRLTQASLTAGMNAYLYAHLTILDRTWLSWPRSADGANYLTHHRVPLAESRIAALPELSADVDMASVHPADVAAIRVVARAQDLPNPWKAIFPSMRDSLIPWQRWSAPRVIAPTGVPASSYEFVGHPNAGDGEYWLRVRDPGTYRVRLGGFSNWGTWARQYTEVEVAVTDNDNNGVLDHVDARMASSAIVVDAASCSTPVVGELMTCTITGANLPAGTNFSASNCAPQPMTAVAGGNSTLRSFTCTPQSANVQVEVAYSVPGFSGNLPSIPSLPASDVPLPVSDDFAWPVDPTNRSRGHRGACADQAAGCYWLSDDNRTASAVWRDAQPFQQEANDRGYGWHLGADYNLGSGSADRGQRVYAAADGVVAAVYTNACGWGNVVMLRHNTSVGPVVTMYAHVDWVDVPRPTVDSVVRRGDAIAQIGDGAWTATSSCNSSGSYAGIEHLHFEVRRSSDISRGSGYTSTRLPADTLGPQGQTDPNLFIAARLPVAIGQLNDTGITAGQCYAGGHVPLVSCVSAEALALNDSQDGMIGRDATHNDDSDGKAGFSFSLVPKATGGYYDRTECVKDNVTGLIWEGKTNDGGARDGGKTYSIWGDGRSGDASAYVEYVNSAALCGFSDWRIPSRVELQGLIDYGHAGLGPAVDSSWFPEAQGEHLVSSPSFSSTGRWMVDLSTGVVAFRSATDDFLRVRLVR